MPFNPLDATCAKSRHKLGNKITMSKRGWAIVIVGVIAIAALAFAARIFVPPLYFAYTIHHQIGEKERQLLYGINHKVFASELRDFAKAHRWSFPRQAEGFDYFRATDPDVPPELRALDPSVIRVFDDRIEFECGGAFLSFGIVAFREGLHGSGTKEVGDGVWFYAEDGVVPKPLEDNKMSQQRK